MNIYKSVCISMLLFLFFGFQQAFSQCWRVYYCRGCVNNNLCPEYRDFNSEREARQSALLACPAADPDVRPIANCGDSPEPKVGFTKSPIRNGIAGALLGGLGGSLLKDNNGKVLWDLGAAGGFSFFSVLTLILAPKARPMGQGIPLGIINGFASTYAVTKAIQVKQPESTKLSDNKVLIYSGAGALGGGILGAVFSKKEKKGTGMIYKRNSGFFAKTSFDFSGNKLGFYYRF